MQTLIDNQQHETLRTDLLIAWKLLADQWVDLEYKASSYEEGRKMLLSEAMLNLLDEAEKAGKKLAINRAEMEARCSGQYKGFVRKMHDARRDANQAKADRDEADRRYWQSVGMEANARAERRAG